MGHDTEATSLDLSSLRRRFRSRELDATTLVEQILRRIAGSGDDRVWIERVPESTLRSRAAALDERAKHAADVAERLPLFGIPFAVKDNIDVIGMATTAGCPAFAYRAETTAPIVARLEKAGAILIGKTNLDQFATGLVGCRSPYGVPRNPFDPRFIPGGSSSGSAVAVASGLVSFALGTDTAGSGRVPAAFNNIIGLKPTRGRISTRGVVPACRSLDCVSIFALTCEDTAHVFAVCDAYDAADPFARHASPSARSFGSEFRFAVPRAADFEFFGDAEAPTLFAEAAAVLEGLGGRRVEIDFAPFHAAADMLYRGPWVAERLAAIENFFRRQPEALLPVTRKIIASGADYSAVDAFKAAYRLAALRRDAEAVWRDADVLLLPTAGTIYTVDAVEAEPINLNTSLGYYTNFVNLLDLAAIAVPGGFRSDGLPFGIMLVAPAFSDAALLALGATFQHRRGLPLGATKHRPPPVSLAIPAKSDRVEIAVAGGHLSGMPLNGELAERGAWLLHTARTASTYRMFLLDGDPPRPGLVRDAGCGWSIDVEIWSLSIAAFGAFAAAIPPPLAIGTLALDDGRSVKGFLCEAAAVHDAEDISAFGGWRKFVTQRYG
jgi:allophanate hydrolase